MADDEGDWFSSAGNDDASGNVAADTGDFSAPTPAAAAAPRPVIPSGPPVPNPYVNCLRVPTIDRRYEHWARGKRLQYHYNEEYAKLYYDDCIDYMDKRLQGVKRDLPRPQEWPERVLRLYTRDGQRLSANDWKYWWTDANYKKPRPDVFHAVHSKESTFRQYKSVLI